MTGEREQEPREPARNDQTDDAADERRDARDEAPREIGGPKGLEPTRYGDWERAGRCVDF